ncbi:MAG: DNA translocase FtsK, partial [Hyphomicrobium sp.]
ESRASPPWETDAMGTGRERGFDESTDAESRAMAERFAPASAAERPAPASAPATAIAEEEPAPAPARRAPLFSGFAQRRAAPVYRPPPMNLLRRPAPAKAGSELSQTVLRGTARLLEEVLADFSIKGEVREIRPGPVVTLFELEPARGTKSSRIVALAEDIARSMSVTSARAAIIPGRNVIGIELPNVRRETVYLRDIFEAPAFRASDAILPLALGKSIGGEPIVADLSRMPHLLVAGTTGSGKSVGVNAMVLSLLYRRSPLDCRLLMIDPKMLELSVYNGIPHLLTPVVTDPQKAVAALNWTVAEMEERYKRMAGLSVRNIEAFNARVKKAQSRGETLARTVQTGFDERTGEAIYEQQDMA